MYMKKDIAKIFQEAAVTRRVLAEAPVSKINQALRLAARLFWQERQKILAINAKDLSKISPLAAFYDRAKLTEERIVAMAKQLQVVASLPSPLGRQQEKRKLPNGLELSRVSVPLGVVGVIYEARPNVTAEVFSLCLKSGNVCILKGGKEVAGTNTFLVRLIRQALQASSLPSASINLLPGGRDNVAALLQADGTVDVIIPRGGAGLIEYVRKNSIVPVIETGAGVVHTYFDKTGDVQAAAQIIFNAKTRRVSVCNALDTLLINRQRLADVFPLVAPLATRKVIVWADSATYQKLKGKYPAALLRHARPTDFGREFLDYQLSIKVAESLEEAINHINKFGSHHSDAIISKDKKSIQRFFQAVDSAVVYANASTAFSDGAEFGLGAEIGISTQKLHARGPLGLAALTSYKWIIRGQGQTRPV